MAEKHVIQVLDTKTANQIAAGEVVEKPASVVKELAENALDAGATQIDVTIFAGGTEYMRVVDNGCGMSEENARLAVLRHATSKLAKAEDLLQLHTLGFRGEALPSIASVSNFTLLTRPAGQDMATSVHIDGGGAMEVAPAGGSAGTTVIVENLFYNVPARRKFLKTVVTEGRYISEMLTRLALSRPDVRFRLIHNEKEVLHTPGDGSLQEAIRALYGRRVEEELLPVRYADEKIKISGYIGKPTLLKSTRQWQTLFVNGRCIVNKMLAKAIDHAYQSQIPKSGFPFAVLNIDIATEAVDVNVHPQKSEVKFSDEGMVYKAMYWALTDALAKPMSARKAPLTLLPDSQLREFVKGRGEAQPLADAQPPAARPEPLHATLNRSASRPLAMREQIFKTPGEEIFKQPGRGPGAGGEESFTPVSVVRQEGLWRDHAPGAEGTSYAAGGMEAAAREPGKNSNLIDDQDDNNNNDNIAGGKIELASGASGIAAIWPIGQVDRTFIIAQSEDTLYLIDQHAAHERVLYDKLVAAHDAVPAQQLLLPLYIDMQADDIERIEAQREVFARLGVDAEAGGANILRVSCLPADIKPGDAEDFILSIAQMLNERRDISPADLRQEVLHMTACKAAIKAGQVLSLRQMRQLLLDLFNTEHPFTCPHGRPCTIVIDSDKLYKMFKRTGF